jgi:hypothetical protein
MLVPTSVMHAARLPKRRCALLNYFALAEYRGRWRNIAEYGGMARAFIHQKPANRNLLMRN